MADRGVRDRPIYAFTLGRCVHYDASLPALAHAICDRGHSGLRPVRQMSGQQVFRATDVCFESPSTDAGARRFFEARLQDGLAQGSFALARLAHVTGELVGVGPARFAIDEQWWLSEPAREGGDPIVLPDNEGSIELTWDGETSAVSNRCRDEMVDSTEVASDGHILRTVEFVVDVDDVIRLNRVSQAAPAAYACDHLDCAEELEPGEACVEDCTIWILPLAISFERVEPFDRAEMCAASVLNPAER